jgi:predicted ATPase
MIAKLSVSNFKSLRSVEVTLDRFTVFVGPNASGKSSILQALEYLCEAFVNNVGSDPHFWQQVVNAMRSGAHDLELKTQIGTRGFRYRAVAATVLAASRLEQQPHHKRPKWPGWTCGISDDLHTWQQWPPPDLKPRPLLPLPRAVVLQLEVSKMIPQEQQVPTVVNPSAPTKMAPDGSGLHLALANMALNDPVTWGLLQADLRQIIPSISGLRFTGVGKPTLLFDTIGCKSLPASQISEGTMLVLGLLAALHAPERPNLVMLDDLDHGLHPKAQKDLVTLLRGLLNTSPALQLIATTHSPFLLDSMLPNEVRVTTLSDDGSTMCGAFNQHPDFERWKDEMTPGEMWSLFGEKWLMEKHTPQEGAPA